MLIMYRYVIVVTKMLIAAIALLLLVDIACSDDMEYRLIRNLLRNYDSRIRPSLNATESLNVTFGLALAQVIDVDEKNQIITTNCWLNQAWIDYKLRWNPDHYGGVKVLRLPYDTIWKPDILLYNNADVSAYKSSISTNVIVTSDGNVTWLSMMIFRSSCAVDVRYFPFDEQNCSLLFASWTYDGYQVNLNKVGDDGDTSNYIPNSEWTLVQLHAERHVVFYSCCTEPYPDITYTIQMRRKPLFYVFNMILPCLLITLVALLGFYVPSDSGEKVSMGITTLLSMTVFLKVSMGITTLLSMTVFLMLVSESMPATSDVLPLVGLYYGITIAIVSLATAMTSFTLNIHHKGFNGSPVPTLVKFVCFEVLAKLLCLRVLKRSSQPTCRNKAKYTKMNRVKKVIDDSGTTLTMLDFVAQSDDVESAELYELPELGGPVNCGTSRTNNGASKFLNKLSYKNNRKRNLPSAAVIDNASAASSCPVCSPSRGRPVTQHRAAGRSSSVTASGTGTRGGGGGTAPLSQTTTLGAGGLLEQRLVQTLSKITDTISLNELRIEERDRKDAIRIEWQQVATVVDRLLLLIFIVATLSITAAILLHAPLSRDFLFGSANSSSRTKNLTIETE